MPERSSSIRMSRRSSLAGFRRSVTENPETSELLPTQWEGGLTPFASWWGPRCRIHHWKAADPPLEKIYHLHQETTTLPVMRHLRLRTNQHHLANHVPGHSGKHLTKEPKTPPRLLKETLQTRYEERYIEHLLNNNEPLNEKNIANFSKNTHK